MLFWKEKEAKQISVKQLPIAGGSSMILTEKEALATVVAHCDRSNNRATERRRSLSERASDEIGRCAEKNGGKCNRELGELCSHCFPHGSKAKRVQ